MSLKFLITLGRRLSFKYAQDTLRSNELQGISPKTLDISRMIREEEPVPQSLEREIPTRKFEQDELDPPTLVPDVSNLSPKKQKLVWILDKMHLNNLITPIYLSKMMEHIFRMPEREAENVAKEFLDTVKEAENRADLFISITNEIKKALLDF